MKVDFLLIIAILLPISSSLLAAFPDDWYQNLPENQHDHFLERRPLALSQPSAETDALLDREIANNVLALDKIATNENISPNNSKSGWHLSNFAFDLGLTSSGAIGIMLVSGQALVNIYWRRKKLQTTVRHNFNEASVDNTPAADLSGLLSDDEIRTRVEPIVTAMMATGKIKDKDTLRENVVKAASNFNQMTQALNVETTTGWTPSRLRLDFIVGASGSVYTGILVGGELRFRLDWFPKPNQQITVGPATAQGENLYRLVKNLANQLDHVPIAQVDLPPQLKLTQMVFSLGVATNGNFGVARANSCAIGSIFFAAPQKQAAASNLEVEPVPVLSHNSEQIAAHAFQAGMNKALYMGSYFARHAAKFHGTKWEPDQLRAQFTLQLGGTVTLATIAGQAAVQAIFQNFGN